MVIRIDIRLEKCVSRFCLYVTQVVLINFNRKSEILSAFRTSTPWRAILCDKNKQITTKEEIHIFILWYMYTYHPHFL
jgi:hypothetical protein